MDSRAHIESVLTNSQISIIQKAGYLVLQLLPSEVGSLRNNPGKAVISVDWVRILLESDPGDNSLKHLSNRLTAIACVSPELAIALGPLVDNLNKLITDDH